ncbi:uncharacterized protein LOC100821964 [Brachypodium distachyon]|uniref:Uncharacterized protein n=1 Tax=Brachypodium distachyon TaxID=15368 RepID=I1IK23_BRADI|nr:uncharacterized protein LOC100821964 [Brachypodium distachyon]KQJ87625.1 hypothetical protein BRADI_4g12600v3 [Brachypodium distachyon]|eukprot:XP_003577314.1 uncharacterized protein LOC100821964 [Brachypodium distachyon]
MDREQMKMAILEQEQTFRQQVHEMHRVYHVQKQLMREMQTAGQNRAHTEMKPKLDVWCNEKATNRQQLYSFTKSSTPVSAEECNLELTLATGSRSSSSSRSQMGKQVVKSSNSDSGTAVSSTSTESELAQFKEFAPTTVRFQSDSKRFAVADETSQSPWLHQYVSLRMA